MHTQETPKSQPEQQSTHIDDAVRQAHQTIGELPKDMAGRDAWNKAEIDKRIDEKLRTHGLTLQDVFQYKADVDRRYVLDVLTKLDQEKREMTKDEKREIIAAQLRVTVNESMSRALDAYMNLIGQYRQMKASGLRAEPLQEQVVFAHLNRIQTLAQERIDWFVKIGAKQVDPKIGQQKAYECEKKLLTLLACTDPGVPGANPEGILPVFPMMLSMLQKEYEQLMTKYKELGLERMDEHKKRADEAQKLMESTFAGKSPSELEMDKVDAALSTLTFNGRRYSLIDYKADLLALRSGDDKFKRLREEGAKNVQKLADLTTVMGRYHISRGELASVRHHFDQMYRWDGATRDVPKGSTPDKAMTDAQEWLEAQQQGSLKVLEQHLDKVDKGVLKVGFVENIENMSNEGRVFMTRLAELVATFETAWIPDIPGFSPGQSAKEYLMGGLYDAVGWPRDAKGTPKKWSDLTEAEKQLMREKQDSIKKSIERFRATGALEQVKTSVLAAKALTERKDLKPEGFMNTKGEIDPTTLPKDIVTDKNIDALVGKYGATTVYKMCFVQLANNWEAYGEQYGTLLKDFHNVVGVHFDMQRYWNEFAQKQMAISWYLLLLAAGVGAAGVLGLMALQKVGRIAISKTAKGAWTIGKATAKGSYRLGAWGAGKLGELAKGVPKTPVVAPTSAPATGTGVATEKVAEGASKLKIAGRILGHLGFIATEGLAGYEIYKKIGQIRSAEHLPDRERAQTALEFWKGGKVPGIPGGMSLSAGREDLYKEEIAVLEKLVTVENLRLASASQTLPLVPEGLPGEARAEGAQLAARRSDLLTKQQAFLETLAQERKWLSIELPFLDKIFTRTNDSDRPGYNVNISGDVPGIKFYGGPLDDATRAGPGNRMRHRDLVRSQFAPSYYADQFQKSGGSGMDAEYWREQAKGLRQRLSAEGLADTYLALHKDMEQYIADVVQLEEKVSKTSGVKLRTNIRQIITHNALGNTIQNPIDVSSESHPTEILSGGETIYLRVPGGDWSWQVVERKGNRPILDPKQRLGINRTAEHFGKLSFSGRGQLAFYRKGASAPDFYVDVK